jgi:signal transduction histidine kinase
MRAGLRLVLGGLGAKLRQLARPELAIAVAVGLMSIVPGLAALLSVCFLAGILAGFRDRWAAFAALTVTAVLQLLTWPQHFRLEAFSPVISFILAPLAARFSGVRRTFALAAALLIGVPALLIAAEVRIVETSLALIVILSAMTATIGLVLGALLDSTARRDAAWSRANIGVVARDLLLGRITTGMIHDLAQPINVVSMANGNLSYLLHNMPEQEQAHGLLHERVQRIAGQTDKAAHLLHNFRSFGRGEQEQGGMLTVRDALERTRIATTSNVRHGGVAVELEGDALDCIGGEHLGVMQIAVAGALLSAFAAFAGGGGEKLNGSVIVNARLARRTIILTITALDDEGRSLHAIQPEPVLSWLLHEVLCGIGGEFVPLVHARGKASITFTLPHGR